MKSTSGLSICPRNWRGVRRERLDVAALALGVDRVEGERRLAGSGQPGEHDQLVAGQLDRDVLEVVLSGTAHDERVGHSVDRTARAAASNRCTRVSRQRTAGSRRHPTGTSWCGRSRSGTRDSAGFSSIRSSAWSWESTTSIAGDARSPRNVHCGGDVLRFGRAVRVRAGRQPLPIPVPGADLAPHPRLIGDDHDVGRHRDHVLRELGDRPRALDVPRHAHDAHHAAESRRRRRRAVEGRAGAPGPRRAPRATCVGSRR